MDNIHLIRWQKICHQHYDQYINKSHRVPDINRGLFYSKKVFYETRYWKLHSLSTRTSNEEVLAAIQNLASSLNKDIIAIPISRYWNYAIWAEA